MTDLASFLGYEKRTPSHQNALDLFAGSWFSDLPAQTGLKAGPTPGVFEDGRVSWGASIFGGLAGRSILELGPFEAFNTYQFQMAGAASIASIEANKINFLKCLVIKNIFNLSATFLHGDFIKYMHETTSRFDICWASGVLYHMTAPIELLTGIRRVSDKAFIWTQYYDEANISGANARFFDPSKDKEVVFAGRRIRLHYRSYLEAGQVLFAGGEDNFSYWMERDDIFFVLDFLGFDDIQMGVDNPKHDAGPAMFFAASHTGRDARQT